MKTPHDVARDFRAIVDNEVYSRNHSEIEDCCQGFIRRSRNKELKKGSSEVHADKHRPRNNSKYVKRCWLIRT